MLHWKLARKLGRFPPHTRKVLESLHADLVHVHFGLDAVRYMPLLLGLALPLVVTLHGYDINRRRDWWESGEGRKKNIRYPRELLRLSQGVNTHFIAVSSAIHDAALAFGIPAQKVTTLHIGIDTSRFAPSGACVGQRKPNVLFVGRLEENKGVQYLLEAFSGIKQKVPDARLTIIGDGALKASLENHALARGLPVKFAGRLPPEALKPYLAESRVLCLPSVTMASGDSEGFGMVLLEAQASGVPVVTSSRGGVEALIHGRTGYYHAEADVSAIAQYVVNLLTNNALADSFSRSAVEFVRANFDISVCTGKLEAFYDRVILRE